jgi:hypothetical protein
MGFFFKSATAAAAPTAAAAVAAPPAPAAAAAAAPMDESKEEGASSSAASAAAAAAAASSSSSSLPPVSALPPVREFIIDCEVVAWDRVSKKILPFQTLSTRKKKDVNVEEVTVQVCLFAFDLLFLNGVSYLDASLQTRRQVLKQHFQTVEGEFHFAEHQDVAVAAPSVTHSTTARGACSSLCWRAVAALHCAARHCTGRSRGRWGQGRGGSSLASPLPLTPAAVPLRFRRPTEQKEQATSAAR